MRIESISLQHVRRFGAEGIVIDDLAPGLNVLTAPNEFGKSTLLDALRAALFVKDSAADRQTRSLRTHGASHDPFMRIAFATAEGRFVLTKCFAEGRRDSMTRLEPPSGPALLGDEADVRLRALLLADKPQAGPVGLLWVRQGDSLRSIASSDKTPMTADQSETMASLLASEVSVASGSDDAREIARRAADELRLLETPKARKPTGALAEAEDAANALAEAIAATREQIARGSVLRAELRTKQEERASLEDPDDIARRRAEREAAQKTAQDGPRLRSEISHTDDLIVREQAELGREAAALKAFEDKRKHLKELHLLQSMAKTSVASLDAERGMAESERNAIRAKRDAARAETLALRGKLDAWRSIEDQRRAGAERERLARDLAVAQSVAAELPALEAAGARTPLDLALLRKAQSAFDLAEAQLAAASPRLRLERGGPVDLDGHTLAAGDAAPVTGRGRIVVGDTVLSLDLPGRETLLQQVHAARAMLEGLFAETNAASLDEAVRKEAERARATERLAQARATLAERAPEGLDVLRERLRALHEPEDVPHAPSEEPADLEEALDRAQRQEMRNEAEDKALSGRLDALFARRTEADVELRTTAQAAERLAGELGPEEGRDAHAQAWQQRITALANSIGGRQHHLGQLKQALPAVTHAEAELHRMAEAEDNARRRLSRLEQDIARIEGELRTFYADSAEARLEELSEDMAAAQTRLDALNLRRRSLRLLIDVIAEEEEERREAVIAPVMELLAPMLEQVFGDAQLRFDHEWTPETLERPGHPPGVADLSAGTREQIAILTRLAFARLMAERGHPIPVILDDALSYADDQRARRLFGVIAEVAQVTQVIVLSCHERLFRDLGGRPIEPMPLSLA